MEATCQWNEVSNAKWELQRFSFCATQPVISLFLFKQPMLDIADLWDKDNLVEKKEFKLSQYKHDYSMTGYKDTPEPWYLNSIAISKSTHQLMAN